jgi:hypothetical protein
VSEVGWAMFKGDGANLIAIWSGENRHSGFKCSECGILALPRLASAEHPFDYTELAGIDPEYGRISLSGIPVLTCRCGESPVLPNLDGLHEAIEQTIEQGGNGMGAFTWQRFLRRSRKASGRSKESA